MKYRKLGRTGLSVSRLCLGCMSFGVPERGTHPWSLNEEQSIPILKRALDAGINFFDTANVYSDGTSEEVLGRNLLQWVPREELVIATKVGLRMRPGPGGAGLSRKAIFGEIDASLKRLRTDHVDLYQIHRWDPNTPIEETLEALDAVVKAGKARYIGASSMAAWQFMKAVSISDRHGWARFVSMQPHLNLLYREEEREMLPLCSSEGIGVIPWSPLARGRLTREWASDSGRSSTDEFGKTLYAHAEQADRQVFDALTALAARRGLPRAQLALAWVMRQPAVTAPIVGVTRLAQLEDALAAMAIELSDAEAAALEAPYVPHAVAGFSPLPGRT